MPVIIRFLFVGVILEYLLVQNNSSLLGPAPWALTSRDIRKPPPGADSISFACQKATEVYLYKHQQYFREPDVSK